MNPGFFGIFEGSMKKGQPLPRRPPRKKSFERWIWVMAVGLAVLAQIQLARGVDGLPLVMGLLLYMAAGIFLFADIRQSMGKPVLFETTRVKGEGYWITGILVLAACLRLFKLSSVPLCVFYDQGFEGYAALKISTGEWHPFVRMEYVLDVPSLLFYGLAFWFRIFPSTQFWFQLFFVSVSMGGLVFVYWAYRQLAGPRIALLTLSFLSIMRWHVHFSRNGFPNIQILFFMFGTIAFFLHGNRFSHRWSYIVAGTLGGLGIWTYQAYKAFIPLLLILIAYEGFQTRQGTGSRFKVKDICAFLLPFFFLISPVLIDWIDRGTFGLRESNLSIWNEITQRRSLHPLWENFKSTSLMFNWRGDVASADNIPLHRMLDDVTGVLWVMGLVIAVLNPGKRFFFYCLSRLAVMSLPCLLSIEPAQANRMLGVTPFVASFAAIALEWLLEKTRRVFGPEAFKPVMILMLMAMSYATFENSRLYFGVYAKEPGILQSFSVESSAAGKAVAHWGNGYRYIVSQHFLHDYSFRFLSFRERERMEPLIWPDSFQSLRQKAEGICFVLEKDQPGFLRLLKDIYPRGQETDLLDPYGGKFVYLYFLAPENLPQGRGLTPLLRRRGLKAEFFTSDREDGKPFLEKWDPFINYTNGNDFPVTSGSMSARWTGSLEAPRAGSYRIVAVTDDLVSVVLDGTEVVSRGFNSSQGIRLSKGPHRLSVHYIRTHEWNARLDLMWIPPGATQAEIIPQEDFGEVR
jgi:hypothetical protein